ncbi:hypothetical protein Hanom_Chr09g00794691 [Helianthus anomalus]
MFLVTNIFDYEKFKVEEEKPKDEEAEKKKRRLESTVNVNEDDESEEEEVDRDEMLAQFVDWGLEEEDRKWLKKEREKLPDFYQAVIVEKTGLTDKIISWKYNNLKGMFIEKRCGGVIQYFKTFFNMKSLPWWDIRDLGKLEIYQSDQHRC